MKEITQAVLDGTYDRPLGRGLLNWRILPLDVEVGETKHIVELADGAFGYMRKVDDIALLTDMDLLFGNPPNIQGLPEVMGVSAVVLYTSNLQDPLPVAMGMHKTTVRTRKAGGFEVSCPPGFEADVVLSDEETKRLFEIAESSPTMKAALSLVGRGVSFICRYRSKAGDALMIVDRYDESNKSITMNTFHVIGTQDIFPMLDGFNYLTSKEDFGYFDCPLTDDGMTGPIHQYMENLGFKEYSCAYVINATPKGE
ncbi:hypothetical protein BIZ78_gp161 [Erwinia phage vB_EamM_Caitlin]|uniref:hypothetical protein n=1 Tax=Erwinia phage vB_EamM_Caitlin TaxID=1883379 RepID=UPI00081C43EE|nr:hypothetical protein BIZ78_gp161 [Erwinia phage vB_EamM_Caitlin]ANZ48414.1 hypothetical protein CAITLIN_119 [Erwinia phage vB_EamM_Caitlin]